MPADHSYAAGQRGGQAISAQSLGIGREKKKSESSPGSQQETGGWCAHTDSCTTGIHLLRLAVYVQLSCLFGVRYCSFIISTDKLACMSCTCASPINFQAFHLVINPCMFHLVALAAFFKSTCTFFFFRQESVNPLSLPFKCLVNRIWWTKALWSREQKRGDEHRSCFPAEEQNFSLKLPLCTSTLTYCPSSNYQWMTVL